MDPYVYKPLFEREIRLLRLQPGQPDQQLSGSIVHIPLTNPTYHPKKDDIKAHLEHLISYDAISYHWGSDPHTPFQLIVDKDSVIGLTAHLRYVLQRVRQPEEEKVLWVDAICINQIDDNSDEKAQQIRLMPDIYRVAKKVQVHLGQEADNSPLAIELLENIAKYAEYLDDSLNQSSEKAHDLAREKGFVLPGPNDERWKALRAFWRRAWFRRVWVIQEFVFAADIVVLCGNREVDWRKLWLAARAYQNNRRLIFSAAESMDIAREAHDGTQAFFTIADLRIRAWGYMSSTYFLLSVSDTDNVPAVELNRANIRTGDKIPIRRDYEAILDYEKLFEDKMLRDRASGEAFSFGRPELLQLFHQTTNFLATKPVDRIFALLGLAKESDDPNFAISYSQPPEVICQRFAAGLINSGHCSAILGLAGITAQCCGVIEYAPTWVPNWTGTIRPDDRMVSMSYLMDGLHKFWSDQEKPAGEESGGDNINAPSNEKEKPIYRAALDSSVEFRFGDDDGSLILKGFHADIVGAVLPGRLRAPPDVNENLIRYAMSTYPTGEPLEEVIWKTLIANRAFDGPEILQITEDYGQQYLFLKHHCRKILAICLIAGAAAMPFIILFIRIAPMSIQIIITLILFTQGYHASPITSIGVILILRSVSKMMLLPVIGVLAWRCWNLVFDTHYDEMFELLCKVGVTGFYGGTPDSFGPPECASYSRSLSLTVNHYNLGITASKYICLLPLSAKIGDAIVIFHGCYTPFVLRSVGIKGHYRLIGECYVHGFMHGELFGDDRFPVEDITLH